ncbi:uncharacterized protein LOC128852713 isoform X1 [Cuculus canorus]|nr:uncharacterized protein LOC128852713 isoform X1 [Cuculus canorus]
MGSPRSKARPSPAGKVRCKGWTAGGQQPWNGTVDRAGGHRGAAGGALRGKKELWVQGLWVQASTGRSCGCRWAPANTATAKVAPLPSLCQPGSCAALHHRPAGYCPPSARTQGHSGEPLTFLYLALPDTGQPMRDLCHPLAPHLLFPQALSNTRQKNLAAEQALAKEIILDVPAVELPEGSKLVEPGMPQVLEGPEEDRDNLHHPEDDAKEVDAHRALWRLVPKVQNSLEEDRDHFHHS